MCGQQSAGQVSPSIFWCFSALYWCVSTKLLYPDLYLWLTPLGVAGGRETGCMSMSRWGPGSSHEWGPQLANSVILVICLIVFRTKKEISCDWWVSNVEGTQLSVSPKWRMPLWSLNASVHVLGLCSMNCACCLYVQYCLALGQKRSC